MYKENFWNLNLQLFNDDPDGGAPPEGTQSTGDGKDSPQTFDDLLANKEYQAEFDRRVNKALSTSKAKWESQLPDLIKQEVDKHKSYEQLSDEEKKQKLIDDEWAKINAAKAEVERSNLISSIKSDLAEKGLPIKMGEFDFAELFAAAGDSEKALQGVNAFQSAYLASIQTEVDKRLADSAYVPGGTGNASTQSKEGERGKKLASEHKKQTKENPYFKVN